VDDALGHGINDLIDEANIVDTVPEVSVSTSEVRRAYTFLAMDLSLDMRGGTTELASFLRAGSALRNCILPLASEVAAMLATRVLTCCRMGCCATSSDFSAE